MSLFTKILETHTLIIMNSVKLPNEAVEDARSIVAKMISTQSMNNIYIKVRQSQITLLLKVLQKFFYKDFQIITCLTEHKCILGSCYQMKGGIQSNLFRSQSRGTA